MRYQINVVSRRSRTLFLCMTIIFLSLSQKALAQSVDVIRAEKTLRYDIGGMVLSVEGKKNLVMLVLSISGLTEQEPAAYIIDAANPNVKYESSTSLWFPEQKVQEDSFQLPPEVKTFRLNAGGKVSKPFTVADKLNTLIKAGSGLK